MNKMKTMLLLAVVAISSSTYAQDYVVDVNGLVCEFCAIGVTKKVSKLPFIDLSKHNKGVKVEIEAQKVTISVKDDHQVDKDALFAAIEDSGYNPIAIWKVVPSGERLPF